MEFDFNTWVTPEIPVTPTVPGPYYYPDLSGNNYHLDDNYGSSFQVEGGPPGNSTGKSVLIRGTNTFLGSNSSENDSVFRFGTDLPFSIFWCMQIPQGVPVNDSYPIVTNYANIYPFWCVYLTFLGSNSQTQNRINIGYQEVTIKGERVNNFTKFYTTDNAWHTYCVTLDRESGIFTAYVDAAVLNTKLWDPSKNTAILADDHEITLFGCNRVSRQGKLSNKPPLPLKFGGFELYDEVLSLGTVQSLHSKYM